MSLGEKFLEVRFAPISISGVAFPSSERMGSTGIRRAVLGGGF